MTSADPVAAHYARGGLLARLDAALRADGVDPTHPGIEGLAPYDQFHGRGIEATEELADLMPARAADRVLDLGSGIGGPARYVATRHGCRVTGIDLTLEFGDVARDLTRRLDLQDRVDFVTGDALAMPFPDASFDGAYSMNVSMNIAGKDALYREIHRVLEPGGWLLLSELAQGEGGEVEYPTPWAMSAETSFLSTAQQTRQGLEEAGYEIVRFDSSLSQALDFAARSRALVESGGKPPHRAMMLIHGELAAAAMRNTSRGLNAGRIVPIEVLARRR